MHSISRDFEIYDLYNKAGWGNHILKRLQRVPGRVLQVLAPVKVPQFKKSNLN